MQVEIFGHHLNVSTTPALSVLDKLPKRTSNVRKIEEIDKLALCTGNSDYNMLQLAGKHGKFVDKQLKTVAKIEGKVIRHVNCSILMSSTDKGTRCTACTEHRKSLLVQVARKRRRKQGTIQH